MTLESRINLRLENEFCVRTGRDFRYYAKVFGYEKNKRILAGKTILDIGAGDSNFAKKAEKYGARVVGLDAKFMTDPTNIIQEDAKDKNFGLPEYKKNAVCGIAQELPFKDESFDEVVALYSTYHIRTGLDMALKEMLRVTKKDGVVKIAPITSPDFGSVDPAVFNGVTLSVKKFSSSVPEACFIMRKNLG